MTFRTAGINLVLAAFIGAGSAHAAVITSLFNTGVDGLGTALPNASAELHYTLTSVPSGTTAVRTAASGNGFPIGTWLVGGSLSDWIGPDSDASLDGPAGNYTYRTTFDLTGFNPASANITGQWAMDDNGIDILLNGVSISPGPTNAYSAYAPFSMSSGFVAGVNTIDFVINNGGGPTGLRVEMTGTANLAATGGVPEPASMLLFGGGLSVIALLRRRKARA